MRGDEHDLRPVLRNLLSNAIKYTGIGGSIEIGASREEKRIEVSVTDNGRGIDEETARLLRQEELSL